MQELLRRGDSYLRGPPSFARSRRNYCIEKTRPRTMGNSPAESPFRYLWCLIANLTPSYHGVETADCQVDTVRVRGDRSMLSSVFESGVFSLRWGAAFITQASREIRHRRRVEGRLLWS